jgi:hypothetical protein
VMFDPEKFLIKKMKSGHDMEVLSLKKSERGGPEECSNVSFRKSRVTRKNLGNTKRVIFTVSGPEKFWPVKSSAGLAGAFVALEKLRRLV